MACARGWIQRVGVGGFSYSDLANDLGIRAPSIHHHFPSKEQLVAAVAAEYREEFATLVSGISAPAVRDRLLAYVDLFDQASRDDMLCLCGALSAEWMAVGEQPRREVERFFAEQMTWLTQTIRDGQREGALDATSDPDSLARVFVAALEGSMLLARVGDSGDVANNVGSQLVALVEAR